MTTLDDLVKVYFNASNEACVTTDLRTPNFAATTMKAGIAAVVRALRPKVTEAFTLGARNGLLMSDSDLADYAEKWIVSLVDDEILGTVAGAGDVAAGASTRKDEDGGLSPTANPAAAYYNYAGEHVPWCASLQIGIPRLRCNCLMPPVELRDSMSGVTDVMRATAPAAALDPFNAHSLRLFEQDFLIARKRAEIAEAEAERLREALEWEVRERDCDVARKALEAKP